MKSFRSKLAAMAILGISAWVGMAFSPVAPAQDEKKPAEKPKTAAGDEAKSDAKEADKSASKVHTVKAGPFRIETELEGILEAAHMEPISIHPDIFQTLEVVKAVPHGAQVKQGDQLVWLKTKELDEQIRETELSIELSELSLKEAREDLEFVEAVMPLDLALAERANMVAQRELAQYLETDRPLAVRSAKQSLKNSAGQLENVTEELRQLEKMYKADDLTEETEEIILKRARRSVDSAELFFELAKVRADRALSESIPEQEQQLTDAARRQELMLAKTKVTLPVERRQKALALEKLVRSHKELVEKLEKLKHDLALLNVTAPADGVVYYGSCQDGKWTGIDTVAKQLVPGKTLTANQVIMTVVQLRPLQVRLSVAEKDLRHFKNDVQGEAVPTAFPEKSLPVTIKSVARIPGASTKFDAVASIELGDDDTLVPGMTCKVKIVPYEKKEAISVPEKAVFQEEDNPEQSFVYVVEGKEEPVKRPVAVGKKHAGKVEITEGLQAGEKILTEKPAEK